MERRAWEAAGAARRMKQKLVVIGNGMAPGRALERLFEAAPDAYEVTIFNAEPRVNYDRIMLSNERSASDPNLIWNGHEVNHQWSKGVAAEGLLRAAVSAHAGLTEPYFSLLRSLSELHIALLFARHDAYDDVVTSCNKAFKLHDPTARWCGDCPKCRFVFLALAPAMDRARLTHIFGHDLFADLAQIPGFLELLGIDAHKPFECVGEVEESLVALSMLTDDAPVLVALRAAVPAEAWAAASREDVLTPGGPTYVPPAYAKILADAL